MSALTSVSEAREMLEGAPGGLLEEQIVAVGDRIDTAGLEGFLRGHGTQVITLDDGDEALMATVCGAVQRVNKLISVRPLKSRYSADLGDVVVGRVTEIAGKRWRVNISARQQAQLMLSAVNLPGGMQRRRTAEDELNMRTLFKEGDLISAEVQAFQADGSVALHTRSDKYGKLDGGTLVTVCPNLIKRQKHHFQALGDTGASLILGCNGLIWVAPSAALAVDSRGAGGEADPPSALASREAVCRAANCIRCLASLHLPVYPAAILEAFALSKELQLSVKDILDPAFAVRIAEVEVERRQAQP